MLLWIVIALAAGLGLGGVFAWVLAGSRSRAEQQRAQALETELAQRTSAFEAAMRELNTRDAAHKERDASQREQIARLETARDAAALQIQQAAAALAEERETSENRRNLMMALGEENAQLKTKIDAEQSHAQEKLKLLTEARVELSNQFETLANKILEEKAKRFTDQNEQNLGNLLKPLKEKFTEFQGKVESLEKDGIAGRSALKEQLDQLRTLNERLSQDATNLVGALRGSSKTQGDWGEFVLESILESSGLRKGYEYRVQESFTREDRSRARLDVILDLPEGRHLVLDSKVSLNDYSDYSKAEDEALREVALSRHLAAVRGHIRDLSQRNYHTLYGLNSLDFVVMFIPIEPAFMAAIARDGKLWQEAWERNILLVSPSTLLFVLRTVAQLWRQEQQTKNVEEIVRCGSDLYDKLAAFAKDLTDVGKSLDSARNSYDDAYKKLAEGRGNVIRRAEKLKSLGVRSAKSLQQVLPAKIAELAIEQDMDDALELAASGDETLPRMED